MVIGHIDVPADYLDYIGEKPYNYNGILFTPACDETYAIETWGYSTLLHSLPTPTRLGGQSSIQSFLSWVLQLMLEKFNRNTEGVKGLDNGN
jgi:hypothetical protein